MLPSVLKHSSLRSDVEGVCTLLQVSRLVRSALRSCEASSLEVDLSSSDAAVQAGFAAWLPDHAGLVGRLFIYRQLMSEEGKVFAPTLHTFSLRHAVTAANPPLCLRSFGTDMLCGTGSMISALAAASLTCLELNLDKGDADTLHARALRSAVASLWNLRRFKLSSAPEEVTGPCLSGLAQLPHQSHIS